MQSFFQDHPIPGTLLGLLRMRAEQQPGRLAYRYLLDDESDILTITYGELDRRARAIGAWLETHGARGERALLLYPSGLDYIAAFFGCMYAGVTAVPAYPPRLNRPVPRIQGIVADSQSKFALTTSTILHNIEQRFEQSPDLQALSWLDTEHVPPGSEAEWRDPNVNADTLAFLQYTSGSTSQPKGVMLTHGNLMHNLKAIQHGFQIDLNNSGAFWLPSYHDMGLIGGILEPLYVSCPSTLISPVSFLQRPFRWLDAISKYKATTSGAPNFAYDLCVDRITPEQTETLDLSSWSLAFCGAEPIRPETLARFARTFERVGFRKTSFYPCFGMAESTLLVSGGDGPAAPRTFTIDRKSLELDRVVESSLDDSNSLTLVNCGKPIIDQKIVIVNPSTLTRCAENEVGEIWVSGPSVARGYWGFEEETRNTFHAYVTDTDEGPFMRTGDLGFLQNDELFVTGRLKDLIIIHGSNHYPQDIELTVEASHAALQPSAGAAFSVTENGKEQLVIVQEVTRQGRQADVNEVASSIRQAVAEKHDLQVFAIALVKPMSIPKTSSGKIQRRGTKTSFLEGELDVVGEWRSKSASQQMGKSANEQIARGVSTSEIQSFLLTRIAAMLEMDASAIDPRQPFTYYGLGSVQAVSLTGDLETFLNRKLSPTLAWDYPTVELLSNFLAGDSQPAKTSTPATPQPTFKDVNEPIAIIGLSCRFPQADSPQAFWELLRNGVDAITEVPSDRWDVDEFYADEPAAGKVTTRFGAFLEDADLFDPAFFGISPREAARMDPQQRLLLEVSWEALENAFIPPHTLAGTRTGVFVGISSYDYSRLQFDDHEMIDAYAGTGNAHSIAANRLSYVFDLRGPSMAVDTACSSSLVSVHLACQSLRNGESDVALAGGVNLILTPELTITFSQARMLAPDGHCKTFDASADGYVRGEGCGVVILKRLSDAMRDGDNILALIRGSAVNQDGRSNGLTAPNGLAQQDVIRTALAQAQVTPNQIGYIEAHGTGTPLGDPIEMASLNAVLNDDSNQRVIVGSVKTNIGHLESAAGIAGLIKVVLAMQNEAIPPHLHLKEINPYLSLENSRIEIGTYLRPWKRREGPRFAGVSSFGFGGTNAHIVLSDAPNVALSGASRHEGSLPQTSQTLRSRQSLPQRDRDIERPRHLLTLSAKTASSLQELAQNYSALGGVPAAEDGGWSLVNFAYTANTTRTHFEHRLAVQASTKDDLLKGLDDFLNGTESPLISTGQTKPGAQPKVAFLFTGQGSQYAGMGKGLYETQPVFRAALDECARILDSILGRSILDIIFADKNDLTINQTIYTQPALFAFEYALAKMWLAWGIQPHAVMGHSVGEYVAACIAGVFTLEDGLHLIAERARLMGGLPQNGTMVAVFADASKIVEALKPYATQVSIAATNGPDNTVISGEKTAVQQVVDELTKLGITSKPLVVSHAFHSPLMDSILDEFESFAQQIQFSNSQILLISNVTGKPLTQPPSAPYWRDHIRAEVKFSAGMQSLSNLGIDAFVEIGPSPVLLGMGKRCLPESKSAWLPSLRQNQDEWQTVLDSLGKLYVQGVDVDWNGFDSGYSRTKVPLPNYPFDRQRYWLEVDRETRKQVNKLPSPRSNGKSQLQEKVVERKNGKREAQTSETLRSHASTSGFDKLSPPLSATLAQSDIQGFIQQQTARILGMDASRLSLDTPLDTLGLDSLMAMELKNSLEKKFEVQLPIASLLQGPTISGLAGQILERLDEPVVSNTIPPVFSTDPDGYHPLTYNQQAMWFLDQMMPQGISFNVSGVVKLLGDLDRDALRGALKALMTRHAVLRTTFHVKEGQPVQRVHAELPIPLEERDAAAWSDEALQTQLEEYAFRSFDLEREPGFRVVLFRRSEDETVLLLAVQHIITDFWSMTLFGSELMTLYGLEKRGGSHELPSLPTSYIDFAHWHNDMLAGAEGDRHWEYWKEQLAGELPALNLPADCPRKPVQTFRGETLHLRIDSELTERLAALGAANNATLYMTLLAAFQTFLHRYSGQTDILVGSAAAGRNHPDLAGVMGYFVNPVALRADFTGNPNFNETLDQVRQTVLDAITHQDFPPALIAERLHIPHRDASRPPLFETTFIYEKAHIQEVRELNSFALGIPGAQLAMDGLTLEAMSLLRQPSQFDLTLMMAETGDGLSAAFIHSSDLFDLETMERMSLHFHSLLREIAADPTKPVSSYSLLHESEQQKILVEWNRTHADYPREARIHELIEAQAKKTPNAVSVQFEDQHLTYKELNKRADEVAKILAAQGVKPGTLVGLFVNRSIEMLVGLLGVLKAGGAYLPLDPSFPAERLAFMLADSNASVILTLTDLLSQVPENNAQVICLDALDDVKSKRSKKVKASAEDLAYIIYTSGSTGKPKGVQIHHRAVVNFLCSMQKDLGINASDSLLAVTTLSFDIAVLELLLPLTVGAKVVIANSEVVGDGALLAQSLEESPITFMQATPASWRLLFEAGWKGKPDLKILCGGEALTNDLAEKLLQCGAQLWNVYGPTETTIWSTIYKVESVQSGISNTVPIGRPIANTQIYILDSALQPVPVGVIGDLYIGGDGVSSRGYLNRPEFTEERFVPHPASTSLGLDTSGKTARSTRPSLRSARKTNLIYKTGDLARYLVDGNIEFFGRSDQQVKVRGYRIETGEIEVALMGHPSVKQAVVVAWKERSSDASLVAYVVPAEQGREAEHVHLREYLRTKLPEYMVPSVFVNLASLPLTPNGKVDRKALPAPSQARTDLRVEHIAPRTPDEQTIADLCAELLQIERVGIQDNFFDLGGNSLLATRLIFQLQERFQVKLPLVRLFENPTVAGLATLIAEVRVQPMIEDDLFGAITLDELKRETILDDSIGAHGRTYQYLAEPKRILLTGGTGFLGAYLLRGLLHRTNADIFCLVRADGEEDGLKRLKKNLDYYELWDEDFASRIRIIPGNLERPRLGISEDQYTRLASDLDVIYHNGAMVNFVYPYHALKPVNVESTREVLRLASASNIKPVHFVSSISVFMKGDLLQGEICYENADLEQEGVPFGGYGQSKWVAEGLVRAAGERGIPVTIFRPDNILGDRRTGIVNTNDMTYSIVRAIFKLGSVPDLEILGGIVPVDFVSDAILHLSNQPRSFGTTFHLSSSGQSNFIEVFEWISSMGVPIRKIPFRQWKLDYLELAKRYPEDSYHAFLPLISRVREGRLTLSRLDLENTRSGLQKSPFHIPTVDPELIETYVRYFVKAGLVSQEVRST